MGIHLSDTVSLLPGIGAKARIDFKNLGILSVRDLLFYMPFRFDDFSLKKSIQDLSVGETVTIDVTICSIKSRKSFKRKKLTITEAIVEDETGEITVTWFNQPYLEKTLKPGREVSLAGRIDDRDGLSLTNPVYEPKGKRVQTGRIIPVYGLTGSLTMRRIREAMLVALGTVEELIVWVPSSLRESEAYPSLTQAIREIHFPESPESLQMAIKRLKFDELFLHQLLFAQVRKQREKTSAHVIPIDEPFLKTLVSSLPFVLTNAQKRAAWEMLQDLAKPTPMNRLLEGDVGSGKTVVAAIAIEQVLRHNFLTVYLAPTEILASQQQEALGFFLDQSIGLLSRGHCKIGQESVKREELFEAIESGKVKCVVGTHALLQESVPLQKVALIIIDEQHRFGVEQRHALLETGDRQAPHLLSMTATPIPRSLSLTLYGDLNLSILDEMPKGRKPIATALVPESQRSGMWAHIKTQIQAGEQVFVVCPLIDPSDRLGVKSVTEVAKELSQSELKGVRLAVLHGKMKAEEKTRTIQQFRDQEIDVLVATTVVEVGVDIPHATVMVIIGAERFGLAQLHQLRGRVGRSDQQSYCYLLPETLSDQSRSRLQAMVETTNGFVLSEKDLKLRGPGNVFGNSQSGFPDFQLATPADVEIMKKARDWALKLLESDPEFVEHPLIKQRVEQTFENVHLE